MPKYPVKSPLKHDGKLFAPGKTVNMAAEAAAPLINAGVLGRPKSGGGTNGNGSQGSKEQ